MEVTLPGGFAVDGGWCRGAWLRPVCGRDEAFLYDEGRCLPPARRTTALLARCLTGLGSDADVTPGAVQALTVGDREALLLHLRRLTLGDRLACVLTCPAPGCGERMDVDLALGDLLLPPYPHECPAHETMLVGERPDERYRVRFRLPTGADQEAVAEFAAHDAEAAAALLLRRCTEEVVAEDAAPVALDPLPDAVARALPELMAALDPQAEIMLDLVCPSCQGQFVAPFDSGDYFFRELAGGEDALHREVHLLASYYHWSAAEIMALSRPARRRYAGLLVEALEARSGA